MKILNILVIAAILSPGFAMAKSKCKKDQKWDAKTKMCVEKKAKAPAEKPADAAPATK